MKVVLFLALFMVSLTGWAQSDAIDVVYDPSQIEVDKGSGKALLEVLTDHITESQRKQETFFIPLAPASSEELAPFSSLQPEEMEVFLAKKQKFLEKISRGFQWLKLPINLHNKVLLTLNQHFFAAAPAIARANSSGVSFRLQVGAGLGLRSLISERLAKLPGMSWYPKSGGFYLALGFGFSLRKNDVSERGGWSLEVFMDFDSLKSVKTFLATAGADLGLLYTTDNSLEKSRIKTIDAEVMGPLGTLRLNDSHFSMGLGAGVTVPPLIDKAMFYSIKEKRFVLLNLDFIPIGEFVRGAFKWFPDFKGAAGPLCSHVFN